MGVVAHGGAIFTRGAQHVGLSALSGVRSLECDMLVDWGLRTADAFALMLSRMPALESLDHHFLTRCATWDQLNARLGPAGHQGLRELRLRYSEAEDEEIDLMTRSVVTSLPRLGHLTLELLNHGIDSDEHIAHLARMLGGLRAHNSLRALMLELDIRYDISECTMSNFVGLAPTVVVDVNLRQGHQRFVL